MRRALEQCFRTSSDLDAFILDYFIAVYRNFTAGMTRPEHVSQLLDREEADDIVRAMQAQFAGDSRSLQRLRKALEEGGADSFSPPIPAPSPSGPSVPPAQPQPDRDAAEGAPPLLFLEYADSDRPLVDQLCQLLHLLEQQGKLRIFHRGRAEWGRQVRDEVTTELQRAKVIVPLVSRDLLASEGFPGFLSTIQPLATAGRHIIPLLARPALWDRTWLGTLKPLPVDRRFLSLLSSGDYEQSLAELAQVLADILVPPG